MGGGGVGGVLVIAFVEVLWAFACYNALHSNPFTVWVLTRFQQLQIMLLTFSQVSR